MLADISRQKWPLFFNLVLSALQIATAFVPTCSAFIDVRALFGILMGGIWGLSVALTLENIPAEARGLFSGLLQQNYALGCLIAAEVNLGAVPSTKVGYQIIFFVGAGFTALIAIFALLIPESHIYRDNKQITNTKSRYAGVWKDLKFASHFYWKMVLYCVLLAMAFNWMSHGAQDVYPNYIKVQKGLGNRDASIVTMIGQCGAVAAVSFAGTIRSSLAVGLRLYWRATLDLP